MYIWVSHLGSDEKGRPVFANYIRPALQQYSRQWFIKLLVMFKHMGFNQFKVDYSLFVRTQCNLITIMLVYMDNIILAWNNLKEIEATKSLLKQQFKLKDMGPLKYFLGIEVARSNRSITISQRKYVLEKLNDAWYLGAQPTSCPIEENLSLNKNEWWYFPNPSRYWQLVGRLIYLIITRPNLVYPVHILIRFMDKPWTSHMKTAYHVQLYLKQMPGQGLFLLASNSIQ